MKLRDINTVTGRDFKDAEYAAHNHKGNTNISQHKNYLQMKELKNVITGCIILPLIFLSSAETKYPKTFAKPCNTKSTICFEKVVDKIKLHRLLDKYLLQAEPERYDFKGDYYLILH